MNALITGASRGIGRVIALELASLGYSVSLVGRDRESLEAVAAEARAAGSPAAVVIPADLCEISNCTMIVDRTLEALGGLDLLVNCAGLSLAGSFTEATPEQWDRVFAVNARAPFFICQAALPALRSSEKPMVINIASVVGFKGYANQSVYASSKHALTGFTKVFAKVLALPEFKIEPDADWGKDLGGDSMSYIDMAQTLNREFKVDIPEELWGQLMTVNDFAKEILILLK